MDYSVDKKLPRTLDYDEQECQCLECHQKRKYARGKKIMGHTPPVDIKRSFYWYQINCKDGEKPTVKFFALCPFKSRFAFSTLRPDIAMRSPPYVIKQEAKECEKGGDCHFMECEMCGNDPSEESEMLERVFEHVKGTL